MIKTIQATFMTVDSLQELIVKHCGYPYDFKRHSFELGAISSRLYYTISLNKSEISGIEKIRLEDFMNGDFHLSDKPMWIHSWPQLETVMTALAWQEVLPVGMYIIQKETEEFHS